MYDLRVGRRQQNKIKLALPTFISANPDIPQKTLDAIRNNFDGTIILSSGLTPESGDRHYIMALLIWLDMKGFFWLILILTSDLKNQRR